jgi:hypothetical protein
MALTLRSPGFLGKVTASMAKDHIVRQGECLLTIARHYGFPDWRLIYDDGANAELRTLRPDPFVLHPGDHVHIPDYEHEQFDCATEARHRFRVERETILFRMHLVDEEDQPRAGLPYELTIGSLFFEGVTKPDGLIEHPIGSDATKGTLRVWFYGEKGGSPPVDMAVRLGGLDPIDTISGVQARLANLGFFRGAISGDLCDRTRSALEDFQERYELTVSGEIDGATKDKLTELGEDR